LFFVACSSIVLSVHFLILRHILLCAEYLLKLTIQDDDFADVWVVAVRCFVAFSFRRFVALLAMLRFVALVLPCCDVVMVSWCLCDVLRVGFFLLFSDCLFLIFSSLLFFLTFLGCLSALLFLSVIFLVR